jgi:hypothetical protein
LLISVYFLTSRFLLYYLVFRVFLLSCFRDSVLDLSFEIWHLTFEKGGYLAMHQLKFLSAILCAAFLFLFPPPTFSQFHYQLTPGISVSETYDDNIDFAPTNEISDYITGLTPSLNFDILTERTHLCLL